MARLSQALLRPEIIDLVSSSAVFDTLRSQSALAQELISPNCSAPAVVCFTLILDYHPVLHNARIQKVMRDTLVAFEQPLRYLFHAPVRCRVAYRNGCAPLFVRLRACGRIAKPDTVLNWSF